MKNIRTAKEFSFTPDCSEDHLRELNDFAERLINLGYKGKFRVVDLLVANNKKIPSGQQNLNTTPYKMWIALAKEVIKKYETKT